ncbi:hypothetical protein HJG60_011821 [Phyllostomus discolor]|uniref:Uncharacterized protein n=1 Tax=Phyllostomus discolor TaxID=89673 RepID=A0A833ZJ10_9CHIR|nr:hypothetical protein HJG60_011821 [Phyllostomus discolor]
MRSPLLPSPALRFGLCPCQQPPAGPQLCSLFSQHKAPFPPVATLPPHAGSTATGRDFLEHSLSVPCAGTAGTAGTAGAEGGHPGPFPPAPLPPPLPRPDRPVPQLDTPTCSWWASPGGLPLSPRDDGLCSTHPPEQVFPADSCPEAAASPRMTVPTSQTLVVQALGGRLCLISGGLPASLPPSPRPSFRPLNAAAWSCLGGLDLGLPSCSCCCCVNRSSQPFRITTEKPSCPDGVAQLVRASSHTPRSQVPSLVRAPTSSSQGMHTEVGQRFDS